MVLVELVLPIAAMQAVELKWLMLKKANKFFGVDVFDLDFGVKIDSIKQPIKSNSVSSGDVSHCRTSAFHNNLNYSFIVLKTHTMKLHDSRIGHLKEQNQCHE